MQYIPPSEGMGLITLYPKTAFRSEPQSEKNFENLSEVRPGFSLKPDPSF